MLDFIKYTQIQLREREGTFVPHGPSFGRARPANIRLPLSTLKLKLPRHAPMRGGSFEEKKVYRGVYTLEGRSYNRNTMPSQSWKQTLIANRQWVFNGPWFTGRMGQVAFSIEGLYPAKPNPKLNFLHPKAFETGVLGYLTASEGHRLYDEGRLTPYRRAPLNWTPLPNLPLPAVQFDMAEAEPLARYRFVFFPASRDKLIHIGFSYRQACAGSQAEQDEKISPKPMLDLIDNIISSIRLTLSPGLEAELEEIRKSCPDLAVSPGCPPLKWPAHVDKDGITIIDYDKRLYATPSY